MERFKKSKSITDATSSEWDESKHPRDADGKFASGGGAGGSFEKSADLTTAASSESESLTSGEKSVKLAINSPAARELHDRISRGELLSFEELAYHSAITTMDALERAYREQYGDTSQIDTQERRDLRESVGKKFLSSGSAVKGADGKYTFDGKIRREYKAVVAIGLPASGKSSRIANPDSEALGAFIFDNDEIKALLPEYTETRGGAASVLHQESKGIQELALQEFLTGGRQGENLVIPTIGSNLDKLQSDWITKLEDAGYDVEVKFADTDPLKSANYAIKRALETGRIIPSGVRLGYKDKPREVWEALKGKKGKGGKPYVRS